jgi:hypothetical protein
MHGNFFTWHNQWYYAFNDMSQPGRTRYFRDSCITYVHYRDNGDIAPIHLDAIGVGQYDAAAGRIEAEDYSNAVAAEKRECPVGGFEMRGMRNGSVLIYSKVMNLKHDPQISFLVASDHLQGGTIEIREGNGDGSLLGSCAVPNTGGWDKYEMASCTLNTEPGTKDICLLVKGGSGELLRLDWLMFSQISAP